jgi:nucleosome binding factor SPN SPT16 subunit
VLVPLKDQRVPFHVSTIKNVSKSEEGRYTYLRINFFAPGTALKDLGYELPALRGDQAYFLHELLFRCADSKSAAAAYRMLKELIKRVKHKDQEAQQKKDLVEQGALVVLRGKRPLLSDLTMRPSMAGKKTTGVLEGHQNGLRFTSSRGEKLDLLYANIKHAFFQPVEHELCVLLHFHLHHGVMVGARKTIDVQFYTEAGVQSDDLGGRARELDEVQLEQRERRVREKLNHEFKGFVEQVQHVAAGALEYDLPYRELGFFGVPFKSNVFLMPTVNCLVNLAEHPFFVCVLADIECVHFERVTFGVRNFDMVLVFKDYTRAPTRISSVPIESLDAIKDWLTNVEIVYSEGPNPLNWPNVMKEITDDLPGFVEQGGWAFLQEDSEEEQEQEPSDQEDSDFDEQEFSDESSDSGSEDASDEEGEEEEDEEEEDSSASEAPEVPKRTKTRNK